MRGYTLISSCFVLSEIFSEWFWEGEFLFIELGMNIGMEYLLQLNYGGIYYMILLFVFLHNVYSLQKRQWISILSWLL